MLEIVSRIEAVGITQPSLFPRPHWSIGALVHWCIGPCLWVFECLGCLNVLGVWCLNGV